MPRELSLNCGKTYSIEQNSLSPSDHIRKDLGDIHFFLSDESILKLLKS